MSTVRLLLSCLLFKEVISLSGNFWHITDLHWDPTYELSDDPQLVCQSSGKRPAANAGKFGDYACDSPWLLINSSVYAMKDILPDPDFIVWTGDDTPPADLGEEVVLPIISNLTHIISQVFPNTKVYSALGNHDFHPKSQLPAGPDDIYDQTAEMWQDWLDPASKETFKKGGYYTEKLLNRTGFRMLVLNTNLYYDQNKKIKNMVDPAGQFTWADQVLTEAANNKEKAKHLYYLCIATGVYIIGHVPQVSLRRREISRGSPISTMFLSPGVTPWKTSLPGVLDGANNPGIRVFEYDTQTLLVKAMGAGKEYRLTESFRLPDASPASMHQALGRIASDHGYLQKYYEFNSVNYDLTECNSDCRVDHVCAAREVDFDRYERCLVTEGAAAIYSGLLPVLSVAVSVLLAN
ncbi:hypothetical protein F7725_018087 [Dissostichus mawsoni]|uniref:Acid sphingomyelinase-like phosphodiesterase n=1 Tax=Dissostichus mawsoni TaxID=36200 RepID=A0A7J5XQN8_DISMA|nr:hypothetical protein F7725_018087 [Dissostichus mawsoni]